ncbi:hypothetical protein SARC_00981 [Sphaeroforma arctica JP610]|uniref:DNA polymerase n=1 Tax=Sphaeroforma arctica JP610 TaxID=667725 RepID=A0A0L0GDC3_9EUKA|nr:hypothetical protein SARC_00981 [Sphaeroforma arctica JP610]KNC86886.1 hypothetical protein SARC_00981 [Sphaeroforma arctica JP610]|eukprot:XP_014160788.1 hypothetical protein SARC_00981 [Sphaeroforma arctica JP610]
MSTKESRARALERIKAAKEGRAVQMELSDSEEDIIEDVSEDEYDRRKKASVLDDFVVDDDGRGYAEDGRDWWEHDDDVGSQTDSDEDAKRSKTDKRKNRKDKKEKKKKDPNQRSINKLFSAMGAKAAKTAAATPAVDTVAVPSDDFLSGLLSDLNEDPLAKKAGRYAHRNKSSGKKTAADIALMGSTSAANELYDKPAQTNEAINLSADHGSDDEEELTSRYQKRMEAIREKRERDASARAKAEVTAPTAVKAEEMLQDFDTDEPGSSSPSLNTVKSEAKAEPVAKAVPAAAKKVPTAVKREIKVRDFDEDPDEEDIELESAAINNDQDWWQIRSETVQKEKLEAQQREKEEEERREKERNIMATNEQGVRKAFVNIATLAPSQSANLPTVTVKAASVQKADASDEEMDTAEPETEEQEEVFRFFYMDIVEEPYKKPGTVFVIGKVWNPSTEEFESACCTVRDIERNLFVLPRDVEVDNKGNATDRQVSFQSVYKEFDSVMERYGVLKWEASMVTRSYAFEYADVPSSAEYLKVKYPMTSQQLPMDLSGRTFARVFGTNTNASELFLLKRKLMGPSWLDVKGFKRSGSQLSWCKWEIEVNGYKSIAKTTDPPPVPVCRLAAISLKTVLSKKTHKHEIVGISVITHKAVNIEGQTENPEADFESFSVIRPLANSPFPFDFESTVKQQQLNITCANNERALLSLFIAKFHKLDPDFIVGHNLFNFDLDILLHRMQDCKVTQWSKMGRMRRTVMPKLSGGNDGGGSYGEKLVIGGRLGVCMWTSARELIKVQTYSLEELASTQLGKERHRLEFDQIPNMYGATTNLVQLMRHCENDAYLIVSLMFKIMSLPLSRQITTLAGNLWARTLSGGRAERSEYLLLHEFHDRKYVLPDKHKSKKWTNKEDENEDDKSKTHPRRKKAQYAGGLVLEPRKGFYDTFILLLDFNSLYPSIIQEYNVCFTTVAKPTTAEEENAIPDVPDSGLEQGVLPYVLATLIERRKQVKNLIKTERNKAKLTQLNIRQLAFKLTANSMYGCLGFSHSRFYAKPLAALVTSKGREILENTVTLARTSLNLDVIYGDTDSIMVNTNKKDLKEVMEIGRKVCKEVNKLYRLLEIDIDGVYKSMLLLKKKKYAALAIHEKDGKFTTVQETKV